MDAASSADVGDRGAKRDAFKPNNAEKVYYLTSPGRLNKTTFLFKYQGERVMQYRGMNGI